MVLPWMNLRFTGLEGVESEGAEVVTETTRRVLVMWYRSDCAGRMLKARATGIIIISPPSLGLHFQSESGALG